MTPRTSHKGEKQNHALEKCIAAANRGWMSEKYLPPAGQEKCYFLTSPFIEPATKMVMVLDLIVTLFSGWSGSVSFETVIS